MVETKEVLYSDRAIHSPITIITTITISINNSQGYLAGLVIHVIIILIKGKVGKGTYLAIKITITITQTVPFLSLILILIVIIITMGTINSKESYFH